MGRIPTSIAEVSPAWLSEVTGLEIEAVRSEQFGIGIGVSSALYRAHLTGPDCPSTVVVKLPALDEAAVFTSTVLRMYLREAGFFHELAGQAPIRVPRCLFAAADPDTSEFVVVMEDLGGLRAVDQLEGMRLADAERAIDGLAAWHATWWGKAEPLAEAGLTVSLADPIYPAVLPMVFGEGWEKVTAGCAVPAAIQAVGPRFSAAIEGLLASLAEAPTTMVHGDYRADNLFFDPDGAVAAVDFQLIGTGSGAYDLAYFLTQSLEVDVASAHERALFDRWISGLEGHGVASSDLGRMWDDYRRAALFCLVYPIVASRGMDLDDPRQHELLDCMLRRFDRAVGELDLVELL